MGKRGPKPRSWEELTLPNGDCLQWTGSFFSNGYGRTFHLSKSVGAHRVAYERAHGPIPAGMLVCHRCDHKWCVQPQHLFLGTPADNLADMVAKGRSLRGTQNHAHRLTPDKVRAVRAYLTAGASKAAVARLYGVAEPTILSIATGRTWAWV